MADPFGKKKTPKNIFVEYIDKKTINDRHLMLEWWLHKTAARSISDNVNDVANSIMNGWILLPQNKCPQLVWTGKLAVCRQTGHSQSWPGEAHDCVGSSRGKKQELISSSCATCKDK